MNENEPLMRLRYCKTSNVVDTIELGYSLRALHTLRKDTYIPAV